jgi:two-component system, cell cycle sensor histidine kinase and response regulator CckA
MNPDSAAIGNDRILIIDDNAEIHADFRKVLRPAVQVSGAMNTVMEKFFGPAETVSAQSDFQLDFAFQGSDGLDMVARSIAEGRPYALAFVDVRMPPGWDGVETITRIWEIDSSIQVVICTAYSDYSWQEIIDRLGKSDRLVILRKPFDSIEVLQLAHALTEKWLVTHQARHRLEDLNRLVDERTRELNESNVHLKREMEERELAQMALRVSEDRLAKAFNASPLPVAILRPDDHGCIEINRAFLAATGCESEELLGRSLWDVGVVLDSHSKAEAMEHLTRGHPLREKACQLVSKGGEERSALLWVERFELASGPHLLAIVQDISEQMKLESNLRQSQKMEAIGHLAAGVAHDLNNLLTVVAGHTSLQLAKAKLDSDVAWSLRQVQGAGERAAALTRQLLAFSRKQVMQKKVVSLSEVIENVASMFRRLIPESIAITFDHPPALPLIYADVCNLEQIVVNLVVNARDAMPDGGTIAIRTDSVEVTPAQAALNRDARAGRFTRLIVSDTGEGMSEQTLTRIFEPFFTTKEVGKGTGMGLATVIGIVQQHDGWIEVDSQLGRGTTFCIYLPVTDRTEIVEAGPSAAANRGEAHDVILLVEDDDDVRTLARCVLEAVGYRVLEAADGPKAITLWRDFAGRIDLLLTDMVMPGGLSGSEVARRFLADRPEGKVLYSSGYNVELFGGDLSLRDGFNYLAKPYLSQQLLDAVSHALTSSAASESATA